MNERFPKPTELQLENLGSGCFVQINDAQTCYWVEIDGEDEGKLTGMTHPELGDEQCRACESKPSRVQFSRDQVKYVGCDRFCFC
ncbi:MAG: hypothetical protein OEZ68_19410 [Gammaproteobacteria bacterium]|nr:hypothetical protein [Gammaproteobacteria bacterium]MDH5802978.1 hypothetical protein [Gammaproteobacteria bacterium]